MESPKQETEKTELHYIASLLLVGALHQFRAITKEKLLLQFLSDIKGLPEAN